MNESNTIECLLFQRKYQAAREKIKTIDDPITKNCWLAFDLALSSKNKECAEIIKSLEQVDLKPVQSILLSEAKVLLGINIKTPLANLQENINVIEQQQNINPVGLSLLGSFYWRKRNLDKARDYYERLNQLFPNNDVVIEKTAIMLLDFKKQMEAREYIKKTNSSFRRKINSYILAWPNLFWPQLITGIILVLLTLVIKFPYNFSVLAAVVFLLVYFRVHKYGLAFAFSLSQLGLVLLIIMYQFFRLPFMN